MRDFLLSLDQIILRFRVKLCQLCTDPLTNKYAIPNEMLYNILKELIIILKHRLRSDECVENIKYYGMTLRKIIIQRLTICLIFYQDITADYFIRYHDLIKYLITQC